jgi:hypothetical protein
MRYRRLYPWQLLTARHDVALATRLPIDVDEAAIGRDCETILREQELRAHFNVHHTGGWSTISLVAANGDPREDRRPKNAIYLKTPVLESSPAVDRFLDRLEADKERVRLMRLTPGDRIHWHRDEGASVDRRFVRVHLPVFTNDGSRSQISHVDTPWRPGALWYGDFSFPHRAHNGGNTDRVILVIDLVVNDWVRSLFPDAVHDQAATRERLRRRIEPLLRAYSIRFHVDRVVRRRPAPAA